jgi:hypothetical protein
MFGSGVVMVTLALGAGLSALPLAIAGAAATGCTGVTVVVQSGATANARCTSGDPSSGLAALAATGHSVEYVRNQPGFVCRIDGRPADVSCGRPPPANAYWSYWYRTACSSTWRYSSTGAGQRDPRRGQTEGWRFGSGSQPPAYSTKTGCATAAAPKPAPAPSRATTHAVTKQVARPPTPHVAVSAAATAATLQAPPPSVAAASTATAGVAGVVTSEPVTTPSASTPPRASTAEPPAESLPSGRRLAGLAVASALIAAVAGAAVLRARRKPSL